MAKKIYYKIGEACKNLDIQPYVLRYWETEFPMLRPDKSSSGQRVYTEKDLAVIRRIKELLYDEGYTIAGAKKKLESDSARPGPRPVPDPKETAGKGAGKGGGKAAEKAAEEPDGEDAEKTGAEESEGGAEDAKEPAKAAESKAAGGAKGAKGAKGAEEPAAGNAAAAEEVATLRKGIQAALDEARAILALLDSTPSKR